MTMNEVDNDIKLDFQNRKSKYRFSIGAIILSAGLMIVSNSEKFCNTWNIPSRLLSILALIVFVAGMVVFYVYWRCPICGKFLSKSSYYENICERCETTFN
jgi:protein-S-isoprenylcysteine O-methyltransferase Ste14